MDAIIILFIIILVVILLIAKMSVAILPPYEKGLVERLGKYQKTIGSGLTFTIPIFEIVQKIDMRERVLDVPPQEVITKDNVVVAVDALIYYQITDPAKSVYSVTDFTMASSKLAQTNLRNLIGEMELDDALTSRDKMNAQLRDILDAATDKWGGKVNRVEIKRFDPPEDITHAMHQQMKAERERRAAILSAEGKKQAAILESEGIKRSDILNAEGKAEAQKTIADSKKYELLALAEGESEAIKTVFNAIHEGNPTNDLIALKYMETLQKIAEGDANKVFIPYEAAGFMGSIGAASELFKSNENMKKNK
jgi:regulator of protease activity HflC (stomatin/prohibitin superfamily)